MWRANNRVSGRQKSETLTASQRKRLNDRADSLLGVNPSSRATVLLGYIPKANRSPVQHQLFHDCLRVMLEPLRTAGKEGVRMECADGFVRMMFPILAAYIADYPEQCLVACNRENSCPRCLVNPKERGELREAPSREPEKILIILRDQAQKLHPPEFDAHNLRPIDPFWADFPHMDVFSSMTPDMLHEIHNGVFGDHIVSWSSAAMEGVGPEIDSRFRAMTPHPTLRHFKKGITLTTQWTGNEHKNMEKVYLGILANATDPRVLRAMDAAWVAFHENKAVFWELEIRDEFEINKLHKLKHYTDTIRSRGTADGYNTENTERLHIDLAKAYLQQMTVWLRRQEAIHKFGSYLQWAIPGYIVVPPTREDPDNEDDDDSQPSAPPPEPALAPLPADDPDDEGELEIPSDAPPSTPLHTVAKTPGFPNLTAASISTDFHAPDFLPKLAAFLDLKSIPPALEPSAASTFPVYKRFSLALPTISEVCETFKLMQTGVRHAKAGQFDTVLVRMRPRASVTNFPPSASSEYMLIGLRVARVRVIFRLPERYGIYDGTLAYVDWFKPLNPPVADIGMHQVSLSSRNLRQNSEVIPITDIVRSCHLIPVFGRLTLNPTWTSEHVLDQCERRTSVGSAYD
ncbi:hypothetical protein B0H14DRAFT_3080756 [Mycena olivaceomarginata]|nr:hypothetical protein B0H14DRAFT_3080756 [Mycena olivaceomarginata]